MTRLEILDRHARESSVSVDAVQAAATPEGVDNLYEAQEFAAVQRVIDINVTRTLALIQKVGRDMRAQGDGRTPITGSIAGFTPGTYQAVYNASKAFLDSFALRAVRQRLQIVEHKLTAAPMQLITRKAARRQSDGARSGFYSRQGIVRRVADHYQVGSVDP